jgi:hypothetical protein
VEDAVEMAAAEMSEVENVVRRRVDGKSIASSLQDTLPHSIPLSLPRACLLSTQQRKSERKVSFS